VTPEGAIAPRSVLVTGGAGFIGANLVRMLAAPPLSLQTINLDKLTYAGHRASVAELEALPNYTLIQADVCDREALRAALEAHRPEAILHLAAESHVDRSIDAPGEFVQTNVVGVFSLLEETRRYWEALSGSAQDDFRLLAVSTDEVYGSLDREGAFTEATPYDPSSPYSASKAGGDHLVRAFGRTYGLRVLVTNCSNNFGPYQLPEKLVPLMIFNALSGRALPIYGRGENVRDWLHVEDHARALWRVLTSGQVGETYNIGARQELRNIDLVQRLCDLLDRLCPPADNPAMQGQSYSELITYVADRPGHDFRYAIDPTKIERELGWRPEHDLEGGLRATIRWYLDNRRWVEQVTAGSDYQRWIARNYERRGGAK
jgi:dTDP-glucose 4,6-dehydratase